MMIRPLIASMLLAPLALGACSTARPVTASTQAGSAGLVLVAPDQNVPDFAKRPFEPFSRTNAVAIALREWRGFGSYIDDDPPGTRQIPASARPDKQAGLWQRVGEIWWLGQDAGTKQASWSSKYNEWGTRYPGGDSAPAWSAAFISYVMRSAGAGTRFPYSPLHAAYINASVRDGYALQGYKPGTYLPQIGDLVCNGRLGARDLRFEDLPTGGFFSHCDIVVESVPGQLTVIGGNVDATVTMRHLPVTDGGAPANPLFPWFINIKVGYED